MRSRKRFCARSLAFLSLFLVTAPLSAQSILTAQGSRDYGQWAVYVKEHKVTVAIHDAAAEVSIEQVFANRASEQLEGIYTFQIPKEATIDRFSMFMGGKEVVGEVMEREKARAIYQSIVNRKRDPGLVELVGYRTIRARVFPIPARGEVRVRVKYSQLLGEVGGLYEFSYPVGIRGEGGPPPVHLDLDIHTTPPLKSVVSPTHRVKIERKSEREARAVLEGPGAAPSKTFRLYFDASDRAFGLKVLTHRTRRDGGYFMLMAAPKLEFEEKEISNKDLVFVIDTSGSMSGTKIRQAKDALLFCLKCLRPGDRFNIVTFATTVNSFAEGLAPADRGTLEEAASFVKGIRATGGTNIDEALRTAFAGRGSPPVGMESRIFQVVFLTDGLPTIGETRRDRILANVQQMGGTGHRLFAFGVGEDVDPQLLDRLAWDNSGAVEYVKPDENLEIKLSSFYEKIAYPVLTDIAIDFGSVRVDDIHPPVLPDLFKGSQLVLFGRYRNSEETSISLIGYVAGKRVAFDYPVYFAEKEDKYEFIPRLWAHRRVAFLVDEIRLRGENQELKEEIVRLGKRWGIVTRYTSFLVVEDSELPAPRRSSVRRGGSNRPAAAPSGSPPVQDPVMKDSTTADNNEDYESSKAGAAPADSPSDGRYWNSSAGIGGGAGGVFGGRFGGRRNLRAYGGGRHTESAVLMGLIWLKNHQNPDGSWSSGGFPSTCKKGTCTGAGSGSDLETTGMAVLAFLGAGHTHKHGKFKLTVKKALKYLKDAQNPDGSFGGSWGGVGDIRAHAICAMALAESFGLSGHSPLLHNPAQKAVDFLISRQVPLSGWGEKQGAACDSITTGWATFALKSAKISGLHVPQESFEGALGWFNGVIDESYYRSGFRSKDDGGAMEGMDEANPLTSSAAATVARIFIMGAKATNRPEILGAGNLLKSSVPEWDVGAGSVDLEYWYLGSLSMFQLGRSYWKAWNEAQKNALVPTQKRKGCENGSWDPVGPRAKRMGRVWSTAVNVLTLEVYYRYGRVLNVR